MDFISRLFSFGGKKNAADTLYPGTWTPVGGGAEGVNERNLLLNNKEWVFIAVDKVANATASVRFQVKRYQRSGDDVEVFDGPLFDFLERPGSNLTGKDFIYLNTVYKELTGNAFWEREKAQKVAPLVPPFVEPVVTAGKLIGYRYTFDGHQRIISAKDVLHDRYIDPRKPYWGVGKLAKIARWVDTSQFSNEFLRRFFLNGATFGGFITTEEESEERIKLIKAGLANDHVGVENAHKLGVLPKGADFKASTKNMSEIEMGATDDRYRDKILAAFGVPKNILGLTQGENRATIEGTEYAFSKYTIKPIVDDLIEFLNVNVAPVLDPSGKYYFAYEDFIPKNMDIELKEREISLAKQQYKTVNEVRAVEGLPPVPGGDVIYQAPFMVPLGTPQEAPEPADSPEDDAEEPKPQKSRSRAIPGRIRAAAKRTDALDAIATRIAAAVNKEEDPDEVAWRSFVGRVESFTEQLADKVRQFNQRQRSDVLNRLNTITGIQAKAVSKSDIFDHAGEVAAMVDFVTPILRGLLTEQAIAEFTAQGFEGQLDSSSEIIGKTINLAAKRLGKSYNNTTLKLLKIALNQGITEGESLDQLTKRVAEVYEYSDTVRARAVAHTETFYIANEGNKEAYRQSGVVEAVRWYTAEDELVCPWCAPQQGKIVGVNENFYNKGETITGSDGRPLALDYRAIGVPPLHTNCRCFIRPAQISV